MITDIVLTNLYRLNNQILKVIIPRQLSYKRWQSHVARHLKTNFWIYIRPLTQKWSRDPTCLLDICHII